MRAWASSSLFALLSLFHLTLPAQVPTGTPSEVLSRHQEVIAQAGVREIENFCFATVLMPPRGRPGLSDRLAHLSAINLFLERARSLAVDYAPLPPHRDQFLDVLLQSHTLRTALHGLQLVHRGMPVNSEDSCFVYALPSSELRKLEITRGQAMAEVFKFATSGSASLAVVAMALETCDPAAEARLASEFLAALNRSFPETKGTDLAIWKAAPKDLRGALLPIPDTVSGCVRLLIDPDTGPLTASAVQLRLAADGYPRMAALLLSLRRLPEPAPKHLQEANMAELHELLELHPELRQLSSWLDALCLFGHSVPADTSIEREDRKPLLEVAERHPARRLEVLFSGEPCAPAEWMLVAQCLLELECPSLGGSAAELASRLDPTNPNPRILALRCYVEALQLDAARRMVRQLDSFTDLNKLQKQEIRMILGRMPLNLDR